MEPVANEVERRVRRLDRGLLLVGGAALLALSIVPFFLDARSEWRGLQDEFRDIVVEKFGPQRAADTPRGLQQVWAKDLDRVDRCVTCHLAVEWKGLEGAPEPFRSHPPKILENHPIARFGCTICHGGQGWAVETEAAHGQTEHWEEPLLSPAVAQDHLIKRPSALLESRCNLCHRYDKATEGMDAINRAKGLVAEKGCRACHIINGRGGVIGPDLTSAGDKPAEQYDFSRLGGTPSVFEWHMAHFKQPKSMSPETIMPDFHFSSEDAQALTLLVLSWQRAGPPLAYLPGALRKDVATADEIAREKAMTSGPGAFFVNKKCFVCHSVLVYGVPITTGIAPDLSNAWEDAQKRFGRTLEDFLDRPSGTMEVVLSRQILLTPAEKKEAVGLLKGAYEIWLKKREQETGGAGR